MIIYQPRWDGHLCTKLPFKPHKWETRQQCRLNNYQMVTIARLL